MRNISNLFPFSDADDEDRLSFGAFIRVSTERYWAEEESIRAQQVAIVQALINLDNREHGRLRNEIVGWYGNQVRHSEGYEQLEFNRLLADAVDGKFEAVIVYAFDRFTGRNVLEGVRGIVTLRDAGVRFFELEKELDLKSLGRCADIYGRRYH